MTSSDLSIEAIARAAGESKPAEISDLAKEEKPVEPIKPVPVPETINVKGIVANLLNDCVHLELGEGLQKVISYQDFLQQLSAILSKETSLSKKVEYFLPQNTFYFATSATEISITCYYPECVRPINYMGTKRTSVVPNIVIAHNLVKSADKWKVVATTYWCTNKPAAELPRQHYISRTSFTELLPFTNVYDGGTLCYGSNVRVAEVTLPDMKGLHWYYQMLFDSPFNNDLGIYALKSSSRFSRNYAGWYEYLSVLATEGKGFPYNELRSF